MFRLFIRKKILSGEETSLGAKRASVGTTLPKRNRRVFARYAIDHKHLMLMNEQDILLVREISAKGFSTEVSPRGFERFMVGDVYEARIRYLKELHDLEARVAWKHERLVGFELIKTSRETMLFIRRLLRPAEIANSLSPVEAAFTAEGPSGKTWFHGDEDSDLYAWHDPETNELRAWQLAIGASFVEWSESTGLVTGSLVEAPAGTALTTTVGSVAQKRDDVVDPVKRQLATDVIMALQHPIREELLQTIAN